jgi:hypothetical protein
MHWQCHRLTSQQESLRRDRGIPPPAGGAFIVSEARYAEGGGA